MSSRARATLAGSSWATATRRGTPLSSRTSTAIQSATPGTAASATRRIVSVVVERRPEDLRRRREDAPVLAGDALGRDVDDRGDARDDVAVAVEDGTGPLGDPRPAAVGADELDLLVGDRLAADRPGERPVLGPSSSTPSSSKPRYASPPAMLVEARSAGCRRISSSRSLARTIRPLGASAIISPSGRLLEERLEPGPLGLEVADEPLADAGQRDAGEGLGAEVGVGADVVAVDLARTCATRRTTARSSRT